MTERIKVSCLYCGATNNYPLNSIGRKVVCGRCKNLLSRPGEVIELSADQVDNFLQISGLPVLVDFHSPTCAPCHIMHPIVGNLASRRAGEIMVIKVNVDHYPQVAARFRIQAVPTYIILFKGSERGRTSGAMTEGDLALWVASKT